MDDLHDLTGRIIGAAMKVHRRLGRDFLSLFTKTLSCTSCERPAFGRRRSSRSRFTTTALWWESLNPTCWLNPLLSWS